MNDEAGRKTDGMSPTADATAWQAGDSEGPGYFRGIMNAA
jgi:hypothetical protein